MSGSLWRHSPDIRLHGIITQYSMPKKKRTWKDLDVPDELIPIVKALHRGECVSISRFLDLFPQQVTIANDGTAIYAGSEYFIQRGWFDVDECGYLQLAHRGQFMVGLAENFGLLNNEDACQPERNKTNLAVRPLDRPKVKQPTPKLMKASKPSEPNFSCVSCDGVLIYERLEKIAQALFDAKRWNGYSPLYICSPDKMWPLIEGGAPIDTLPIKEGRVYMSAEWERKAKIQTLPDHRKRLLDPAYGQLVLGAKRSNRRL